LKGFLFLAKSLSIKNLEMQSSAQIQTRRRPTDGALNIGKTPLVEITSLGTDHVKIFAKLEWQQAGASVKARAANEIVNTAIQNGRLKRGVSLLDASSGNTAIAYASLLKRHQIRATICLPANASAKRISVLRNLGVELVLTSPFEGTEGAQAEARRIFAEYPDAYYYADQYGNPANWLAHYHGTGVEILNQTSGKITHFVAGLGTTGTFVGTVRRLKNVLPDLRAISLQPDSPMHALEGWKHLETAKVPAIYDPQIADGNLEIDSDEAYTMIEYIARHEGYLISPSSAANLVGAKKVAGQLTHGDIVTVLPDSLERYDEVSEQIFGKTFDATTL
jgi:cysteine synthase B